jgi:hypothetical protein
VGARRKGTPTVGAAIKRRLLKWENSQYMQQRQEYQQLTAPVPGPWLCAVSLYSFEAGRHKPCRSAPRQDAEKQQIVCILNTNVVKASLFSPVPSRPFPSPTLPRQDAGNEFPPLETKGRTQFEVLPPGTRLLRGTGAVCRRGWSGH